MRMNSNLLTSALLAVVLSMAVVAIAEQKTFGKGLLRIHHPKGGETVAAGSMLAVDGTSAPNNSTHTGCTVGVLLNAASPVSATPTSNDSSSSFMTWKAVVGPIAQGPNAIEGEFKCKSARGAVNLVKHLVHNVTGVNS